MAPGKLSHKLWDNFSGWPRLGECSHVEQVAARETGHLRELGSQVVREPVDDLGAPPFGRLAVEDHPAEVPVETDEFAVDGEDGAGPGGLDRRLRVGEHGGVVVRDRCRGSGHGLVV